MSTTRRRRPLSSVEGSDKELARTSDGREQDLRWQILCEGINHEHAIRAGHRPSMNAAQLSELDIAARDSS